MIIIIFFFIIYIYTITVLMYTIIYGHIFFQVKMWGFLNSVDIAIQRLEDAQEAPGFHKPPAVAGGWVAGGGWDVQKKQGSSYDFSQKVGKSAAKRCEIHKISAKKKENTSKSTWNSHVLSSTNKDLPWFHHPWGISPGKLGVLTGKWCGFNMIKKR